jgi:hypothetical protein
MTSSTKATETPKPVNAAEYKKAVALGKALAKQPDMTKAEITRQMYPLISGEDKKVIAQAFIEGAGCTEKGALTYVYNVKRQLQKQNQG